jgi:hypothetical protein
MSLNNLLKTIFSKKKTKKINGGVGETNSTDTASATTDSATATATNTNKIKNGIVLFFLYFLILCVVGIGFDKIAKHETGVSQKQFTYAFATIFIVISILIFIFGGFKNSLSGMSFPIRLIFLILAFFIFISVVYFFNITSYLFIGIAILIIIVGLAIIINLLYNIFEKSIQNTSLKFAIEFIFFIPCLFNDILKWGLEQVKMTSYLTYILLAIEVSLILAYFYLPSILNKTIVGKGQLLQDKPFYINKGKTKTIATTADLKINTKSDEKELISEINSINYKNPFFKDYAFSMWINMNPHSLSKNTEITIFSYGYPDNGTTVKQCYKPKITYTSSSNNNAPSVKDVYRIYFTGNNNEGKGIHEIHIPNQRWNHFVINYVNGSIVELWINGVMKRTFKFDSSNLLPNYDPTDQVVIGNNTITGTNGAICSVMYFNKSISSHQITNMYNLGINTQPYPGIQK